MNGALSTVLPPQELVMVSVPVDGGLEVVTVPLSVYLPLAQGLGTAVRRLQFVDPAPAVLLLV